MPEITCSRCGLTKSGFERPPFPGPIGQRIVEHICQDCWGLWLRQQTMLINHYGLNVMDPQARSFLKQNMEAFLFKKGAEEDVDTSKKGTIQW
jgi:Fe-S cluster biosynthesis and repair protein YggX